MKSGFSFTIHVTFKSGGFWRCIPTRWSSRFTDGKAPSSDTDLRCAPKKVPSSDVTAIVFEHEMFKWMDHELRKKTNKTQVGSENSEGSLSWMCDINQWISTAQLHTLTARCPPRQEGPQGLWAVKHEDRNGKRQHIAAVQRPKSVFLRTRLPGNDVKTQTAHKHTALQTGRLWREKLLGPWTGMKSKTWNFSHCICQLFWPNQLHPSLAQVSQTFLIFESEAFACKKAFSTFAFPQPSQFKDRNSYWKKRWNTTIWRKSKRIVQLPRYPLIH